MLSPSGAWHAPNPPSVHCVTTHALHHILCIPKSRAAWRASNNAYLRDVSTVCLPATRFDYATDPAKINYASHSIWICSRGVWPWISLKSDPICSNVASNLFQCLTKPVITLPPSPFMPWVVLAQQFAALHKPSSKEDVQPAARCGLGGGRRQVCHGGGAD
jgi:hypothetical protein